MSPTTMLKQALEARGERAIMLMFRVAAMQSGTSVEERIPFNPATDTVIYEMSLRYGRADIVIFHADGSASVIEVKDGGTGYNHVVAGIGQAGLYATQLATSHKGALTKVRKCLLWTSTGDSALDTTIEDACIASGTVPLPWGRLRDHLSALRDVLARFEISGGAT